MSWETKHRDACIGRLLAAGRGTDCCDIGSLEKRAESAERALAELRKLAWEAVGEMCGEGCAVKEREALFAWLKAQEGRGG